jgi:hypothetical protein
MQMKRNISFIEGFITIPLEIMAVIRSIQNKLDYLNTAETRRMIYLRLKSSMHYKQKKTIFFNKKLP